MRGWAITLVRSGRIFFLFYIQSYLLNWNVFASYKIRNLRIFSLYWFSLPSMHPIRLPLLWLAGFLFLCASHPHSLCVISKCSFWSCTLTLLKAIHKHGKTKPDFNIDLSSTPLTTSPYSELFTFANAFCFLSASQFLNLQYLYSLFSFFTKGVSGPVYTRPTWIYRSVDRGQKKHTPPVFFHSDCAQLQSLSLCAWDHSCAFPFVSEPKFIQVKEKTPSLTLQLRSCSTEKVKAGCHLTIISSGQKTEDQCCSKEPPELVGLCALLLLRAVAKGHI